MNLKVVLGIVGVAIVIGGVICFVSKEKVNRGSKGTSTYEDNTKESTDIAKTTEVQMTDEVETLKGAKEETAEKMKNRHEEAEKIVRESVDNIFGDLEGGETKNEAVKKKMFADLDNM